MSRPECSCHGVPMYQNRGRLHCKVIHDGYVARSRERRRLALGITRRAIKKGALARSMLHGTTPEMRAQMMADQAGCCGICGAMVDLVLDHDHATGRARAYLCAPCNVALGFFRDDPIRMVVAAQYVQAYR